MKAKHLLKSPYRRGFPGLNAIVQDHERFVGLIEEHRQKMIETRDDEVPHRLPLYGSRDDAIKNQNVEFGIVEEGVALPEPIGWVVGFHINSLGQDYDLSLWVEYDKDVLGENFFNNVRFGYYSLIGTQERAPNGITFSKAEKLSGFHIDPLTDEVSLTGIMPQSKE